MMTETTGNTLEIDQVRSALEADYEILEELGRGGMAVVYRARDKALDREVAIKVLPSAMAFDSEFVERFQREARTAGQLEHPHIVPIYRVGRLGNVIFFVMKFLRGQSLASVLRERGKLAVPELRRILLETSGALGYAAKRGVVHRDIKPDNILLDDEGRCVVTDFGIAKTSSGPRTAAGTSMGTPRYMSPEHAQGTPVDGRSDIYSLGVVAYQCLSGATPFNADDPFAILYKHINEPLPRPSLSTDEEEKLYEIIERMLAKSADDRFQAADEIIFALGGDISAPRLADATGPLQRTMLTPTMVLTTKIIRTMSRYNARNWRVWALAAGLIAVIAGVWSTFGGRSANDGVISPAGQPVAGARVDSAKGASTAAATAPVTPPASVAANSAETTKALALADGSKAPVTAARTPRPAPEPFSRCPRAAATDKARTPALLVDSVRAQKPGAKLALNYDICGLDKGMAFSTNVTLRKINQSRMKRMVGATVKPVTFSYPDVAGGPRVRKRRTIDLGPFSPGTYVVDVAVSDQKGRALKTSKQFELLDK